MHANLLLTVFGLDNYVAYVIAIAVVAVASLIAFLIGIAYRKNKAERSIGSAQDEARRIVSEAMKTAETKKRESILEAKDEIHKIRTEADKELRERRSEVQRQEHR
jgi:ribonuclease Y